MASKMMDVVGQKKSSGGDKDVVVMVEEKEKEKVVVVEEEEEEEEEEVVLPGFRFHPTDEELVGFYLRRKVNNKPLSIELIKQIDIYKYDPWDLPKVGNVGDKEWYFFCLRGRKYRNSIRPNRVTGSGFWKATGIDRPIYSSPNDPGDCIGLKKSLVYYRGSAGKGTKTDWMMHEFRLPTEGRSNANHPPPSLQEAEIWTICRIFKRNSTHKRYPQQWRGVSSNNQIASDSSSKTNSFESDNGDEFKCFRISYAQQSDQKMAANYFDDRTQFYVGQMNPMPRQAPLTTSQQSVNPHPNMNASSNEMTKDGSWDELGRMMEFMIDQPALYEGSHSSSTAYL